MYHTCKHHTTHWRSPPTIAVVPLIDPPACALPPIGRPHLVRRGSSTPRSMRVRDSGFAEQIPSPNLPLRIPKPRFLGVRSQPQGIAKYVTVIMKHRDQVLLEAGFRLESVPQFAAPLIELARVLPQLLQEPAKGARVGAPAAVATAGSASIALISRTVFVSINRGSVRAPRTGCRSPGETPGPGGYARPRLQFPRASQKPSLMIIQVSMCVKLIMS